jgi:hypothetical protein
MRLAFLGNTKVHASFMMVPTFVSRYINNLEECEAVFVDHALTTVSLNTVKGVSGIVDMVMKSSSSSNIGSLLAVTTLLILERGSRERKYNNMLRLLSRKLSTCTWDADASFGQLSIHLDLCETLSNPFAGHPSPLQD